MSTSRRTWIALGVVGLLGLAVLAVWIGRDTGLMTLPGREGLRLSDPSPTRLDTLTIDGRRVTASVDGVVRQLDDDGTVWLEWAGDAFPLRYDGADTLRVEDRALVVGRLRSWRGQRWLEVGSWTPVVRSAR